MKIWCVEDDLNIREIECYTLKSTGFEAEGFEDADALFQALSISQPDLIVLDVMLPKQDGISVLKQLKGTVTTQHIPVIMATAKDMEYDIVQCLDMGADDYMTKPFGMMEFISRIKAVLRRHKPHQPKQYTYKDLRLDPQAHRVALREESLALTYKEFEMLRLFLSQPGRVFSREQMYEHVWQDPYVGQTRTVDMHIRTLRQKLLDYGQYITTIRNVGYRWEEGR